MHPVQLTLDDAESNGPRHLNQGLFSDYYLNEILPKREDWLPLIAEARPVYAALREQLDRIHPEALAEAQLENHWIQPIFDQLGYRYTVQAKIRYRRTGYRNPDYVLVRTAEAAYAMTDQIYTPHELREAEAVAVADAKRWGIHFDQASAGQRNPSQQIDEYLRYSELPWGILTDGRIWRLYERNTSKNNVYYAVDLIDLLERDDVEAFLYFYAFFRQAAFTENWLRTALEGSVEFAQRLSDRLEDQVYEALELIAQGFLEYRRNRLKPTPETLQMIYEQSLVLLYRMLFILYAESREILPLHQDPAYTRGQSFDSIKKSIACLGFDELNPDHTKYYTQISDLFFSIDQGNPQYALPAYNGRLFTESEHPFLAENAVGDRYFALALDRMARVPDDQNPDKRVFVDYGDLDVRHLGAIYEKLLEYQIDIATEPLTLRRGKYETASRGDEIVKQPGEVYLRTGNNERKITGSYYTPDYIVRFIIERTLEPLMAEITERYATIDSEEGHWRVHDPGALREAILSLNVLDPATGSGHFLVEASLFIAEWLRSLSLQPADLAEGEDELIYWQRQVVNACIYGVDVNRLAVELAKLSLWLATLAQGKPLSFLDHHIKVGDSLVGARASEIGATWTDPEQEKRGRAKLEDAQAGGQLSFLEHDAFAPAVGFAVGEMAAIEDAIAESIDVVKQQEAMYARMNEEMAVWQRIADVWAARYFGLQIDQETWKGIRAHLLDGETAAQDVKAALAEADRIAGERHFLHWDLSFPEIFFNPDGTPREDAGFDAVIGNPPYVRQERIQPVKPFLEVKYDVYQGTADLFLYFYERGLRFLKPGERLGYITSGTYMNSNSASAFREYVHDHASFETVVNFGENQPFRGAEMVYPTIAILKKAPSKRTFRSLFIEGTRIPDDLDVALAEEGVNALSEIVAMDEWRFQAAELTELFRKIIGEYPTLGSRVNGRMYRGITTGLNDAFIIDQKTRNRLIQDHASSADIIKRMIHGSSLRPWYQMDSGDYLIFSRRGIEIDNYPAVKQHLEKFQERLEPKPDDWNRKKGRWPGRKSGTYEWYEIQDSTAYYQEFDESKIFWAEIAKLPRFSWDEKGLYASNKAHMLIPESISLLGLLNSRVSWFVLSQLCVPLRLRAGLWQYQLTQQFVERLPIPELSSAQESELAEIAEAITAQARERYALHESVRHRIATDLGEGGKLNTKLTEWWALADGAELRAEVKKAFRSDIPLSERDDWEKYLAAQQAKHESMTEEIVVLETRMNAIVYAAFDLTPEEIALIEEATRYPYGSV